MRATKVNSIYLLIPVTNQNAYFRVLERYQFKAVLCNNGRSLIKSTLEGGEYPPLSHHQNVVSLIQIHGLFFKLN